MSEYPKQSNEQQEHDREVRRKFREAETSDAGPYWGNRGGAELPDKPALSSGVEGAEERITVLEAALRKLANEASGFLALSDIERHGQTNSRILRDRIEQAREALAQPHSTAQEKGNL